MNIIQDWTMTVALTTVLVSTVISTQSAQAQSVQIKEPDTFTELYNSFVSGKGSPLTGLIQATDGNLYGSSDSFIYKMTFSGTLTWLSSSGTDLSGLPIQAADENLYWTSVGAGRGGAVFKTTLGGTSTLFYGFCSLADCADGAYPYYGPLVQVSNGDFYGTTYEGGLYNFGTVFKLTPKGKLTTLHSFCSQTDCTDGENPVAGLVQATTGDFYGTTYGGGANGSAGTVFKITPGGTLTTLYSFCSQPSCADGGVPHAALIQATNGDFYGTTQLGGLAGSYGTVFKITASGKLTTLYRFCSQPNCTDGEYPFGGLVQATDGDFYGTTGGGGANGNEGTVFKITNGGKLTTLHSFCSQSDCTDGSGPRAGLMQATNGTFYGTTAGGGANGFGYRSVSTHSWRCRPLSERPARRSRFWGQI
jgi:uncharacterized repeat protein (TIGR03803 family)